MCLHAGKRILERLNLPLQQHKRIRRSVELGAVLLEGAWCLCCGEWCCHVKSGVASWNVLFCPYHVTVKSGGWVFKKFKSKEFWKWISSLDGLFASWYRNKKPCWMLPEKVVALCFMFRGKTGSHSPHTCFPKENNLWPEVFLEDSHQGGGKGCSLWCFRHSWYKHCLNRGSVPTGILSTPI